MVTPAGVRGTGAGASFDGTGTGGRTVSSVAIAGVVSKGFDGIAISVWIEVEAGSDRSGLLLSENKNPLIDSTLFKLESVCWQGLYHDQLVE